MATLSQQSTASAVTPDHAAVRASHPFTCNTCQVAFRSSDMQRAHMQTDWHRYNLKRRVASLPPLASEVFTEKVLANKATAAATAAKASFETLCSACNKTYYSQNAHANHLNSQKHKANVAAKAKLTSPGNADDDTASMLSSAFSLGEPDAARRRKSELDRQAKKEFSEVVDNLKNATLEETTPVAGRPARPHHSSAENRPEHPISRGTSASTTPSVTSSSENKSPLLDCLFCNYRSPTFPLNTLHMNRHHGLFIPEQEYLVDAEGLVTHLHEKISEEHQCLYCGKYVHTTSGIQTHMRDRGHCMINFDGGEDVLDIGQFYDFSSTWASDPEDDSDGSDASDSTAPGEGGVKLETTSQDDNRDLEDGEDEGWETSSTLSDVPTDEITSIPISDRSHRYKLLNSHRHHSHSDPRKHRRADGWVSHAHPTPHAVYYDDYELHLPTGRTAGHRSLNRYYRQNLRSYPTPAERIQQRRITAGMVNPDSDDEMEDVDEPRERGRVRGNDPHRNQQLITRANGGLGMMGVSDEKKREIKATEKREKKRELREKTRYAAGNEKRGNFQKHYRDPLLQ